MLKEDFNFVELTDFATTRANVLKTGHGDIPLGGTKKDNDWFLNACKTGIECDILVVSGHFGGAFFGESGLHLSLTELQSRSCKSVCDGILKKPKEVFLFGCNTTASKDQDHRTPEEYTRVLINDGFSRRQAEQISAFRYSPIGEQTKDRMRQVFSHSRIYGFHSQAPYSKNIASRLRSYFESIDSYQSHLEQFPTTEENRLWSQAMKGQWIRSVDGDGGIENPVCVLEKDLPIYKKLSWVEEVLSDEEKSLSYIPVIDVYLRNLERKFGEEWDGFPSVELSLMESIQFNEAGRLRVDELLKRPISGVVSAQVQVLNFGKRVGWYNRELYNGRLKGLIGDIFKENLNWEQRDFICSLEAELDLSLEDLPEERWNSFTIVAIGCIKPSDPQIHLAIAQLLKDTQPKIREIAAWALGQIKPSDPQVLLALTSVAFNTPIIDRPMYGYSVYKVLNEIKPFDPQIHLVLIELLKDTQPKVRESAAGALGYLKPSDPQIQLAIAQLLKDTQPKIREIAAWALGQIKPSDPQVLLALTSVASNDTDRLVRQYAAEALNDDD